MRSTYEGKEPYIFISYSHRNSTQVLQVIDHLQAQGFRVWFDAGIEAGSEWPEYIAAHLSDCARVIAFISPDFVDSDNCRRELNFALDLKKPVLSAYISDVELPVGLRMQLGLSQALYRNNFSGTAAFLNAISGAKLLQPCKEVKSKPPVSVRAESDTRTTNEPKPAKQQSPEKRSPEKTSAEDFKKAYPCRYRLSSWLSWLVELSYIAACIFLTDYGTNSLHWSTVVLILLALHPVITLINRILLRYTAKPMGPRGTEIVAFGAVCMMLLSTVLAVIFATPHIAWSGLWIVQFLASLGMNIVPTVISFILYFTA